MKFFGLIAANYTNRAISPLKEAAGGRRKNRRKKEGGREKGTNSPFVRGVLYA